MFRLESGLGSGKKVLFPIFPEKKNHHIAEQVYNHPHLSVSPIRTTTELVPQV